MYLISMPSGTCLEKLNWNEILCLLGYDTVVGEIATNQICLLHHENNQWFLKQQSNIFFVLHRTASRHLGP